LGHGNRADGRTIGRDGHAIKKEFPGGFGGLDKGRIMELAVIHRRTPARYLERTNHGGVIVDYAGKVACGIFIDRHKDGPTVRGMTLLIEDTSSGGGGTKAYNDRKCCKIAHEGPCMHRDMTVGAIEP
jgi:hypothetical protein